MSNRFLKEAIIIANLVIVTSLLLSSCSNVSNNSFENFAELPVVFEGGSSKLPKKLMISCKERVSGSAQFNRSQLIEMKKILPSKKIVIFDLREEPHCLIDNKPVVFFNSYFLDSVGIKNQESLEEKLKSAFKNIKYGYKILKKNRNNLGIAEKIPITDKIGITEKEMVESLGLKYKRLTITDHRKPEDDFVDSFVKYVDGIKEDTWIHFHCRGGRGRTGTAMVMYILLKSKHNKTFEKAQKEVTDIGGKCLIDLEETNKTKYLIDGYKKRLQFLKEFEKYVVEHKKTKISWYDWKDKTSKKMKK